MKKTDPTGRSQPDLVLEACLAMEQQGKPEFTNEDLVAACFTLHPAVFAMAGYPQYPDSHKVRSQTCGEKGLVGCGYLERLEDKRLRLTEYGRKRAADEPELSVPVCPAISAHEVELVEQLLGTDAMRMWSCGQKNALMFADARAFWRLPMHPREGFVEERLAHLDQVLTRLQDYEPARLAWNLHGWLKERFSPLIRLLVDREQQPKYGKAKVKKAKVAG